MRASFDIEFQSAGRKAQCPPNAAYPDGIDLDLAKGATSCIVDLPYPAECVGAWVVLCEVCGATAGCTAAGRPDDPRSMKVPCNLVGAA